MRDVFNSYLEAFDELNIITTASYYSATTTKELIDDILSVLIRAYRLGIETAGKMMDDELSVDVEDMLEVIYCFIDGKTFEDRAKAHVAEGSLSGLETLVESEFERVFNAALYNGGKQYQDTTGETVSKIWYTMMDDRVRDTHGYLESMVVPLDDYFYTWDGDAALTPHGFSRAENNVNCRCVIMLIKG